MSDRTLYIAYSSNTNLEQMSRRCPTAKVVANGVMLNYELEFRGVATIVPKADAKTPVLVWELGQADEKSLDRYEGFPHLYRKEYFEFEYGVAVAHCGIAETAIRIQGKESLRLPFEIDKEYR